MFEGHLNHGNIRKPETGAEVFWLSMDLRGACVHRCPFPVPRKEWTKTHELVGVPDGCLNSYAPLGEWGQGQCHVVVAIRSYAPLRTLTYHVNVAGGPEIGMAGFTAP